MDLQAILTNQSYAVATAAIGALFLFFLRFERSRLGQLAADFAWAATAGGIIWFVFLIFVLPNVPFLTGVLP